MRLGIGKVYLTGLFCIVAVIFCNGHVLAQDKNYKARKLEKAEGENNAVAYFDLFAFPNVNRISYFTDKRARENIRQLDKKQEWNPLYTQLREYVGNFGIENFYKDTYLLWRLAKLTELLGDAEEAKALYRLVLKHHREDLDISRIELYYDSLTQNDKNYYVPLEYYYELVEFRRQVDTLIPPKGVLLNMGPEINSPRSDYGPTLNVDDGVLLFTSRRNAITSGMRSVMNEDIFYSTYDGAYWTPARMFQSINTRYNEGSACLSRDGRTLYFSRCHSPDSKGNCDLFVATLQADSTWSPALNLGPQVNSSGWDSHPSLSHTEDTLYFASDRIGGFGLSDIWYTFKQQNGTWAPAQNAGPVINTRNNEVSPFYHPQFDILYFSSNGQLLNFGEFDIYKSYHIGKYWTEPQNIGPLVNGAGSEYYFTIDAASRNLYYARSNENQMENMDLYSFPLPMEAQPEAVASFSGSLTDTETGKPYTGIVSVIDLDNGIEVAPKFLRPDGTFQFDLIDENNYLLIIQGNEYFRIEEAFFLQGDTTLQLTTEPISSRMKFASIEFENASAELLPEMFADLDRIIDFLLDNPDFKLRISGHTDSDGTEDLNLKLSQERADAIKAYIVEFGKITPDRIEAKGFGSSKPITAERDEEAKKLNRRVEFEIYRPKKEETEAEKEG